MMIPPASARKKWLTLTIAVVVPLTLVGAGVREQQVEASQSRSLSNSVLPDGTYLYSDAPQPNQVLHQYVLFQQREGKVVGAFYSPQAEFSCFAGQMQGNTLDVEAATLGAVQPVPADTSLSGLYPLRTLSPNDQRILSICQQSQIARSAE